VDALTAFLDGPRARAAFLMKVVLEPPWALRIEDEAPLAVVACTHGTAWMLHTALPEPTALAAGDVVIVRGPEHYVVADSPATDPTIVIEPGGSCRTLDGRSLVDTMDLGVRTWGNDRNGRDVMVVGTYQTDGEVSRRLLEALPPVVVLRADECGDPVVPLLAAEVVKEEPGQQVVLDRLLDLLLVTSLRAAFASEAVDVPAWFRANRDPVIGRVLRLMQNEPASPWTVATLAAAVGVSRAWLARRFHELVGEPPIAFLTSWRLALAADLLTASDATIGAIAHAVGYGSPFTFSTAFKREHGSSPKAYRSRGTPARASSGPDDTALTLSPGTRLTP
jgi:AraC-like DNA-binding protein